MRGNPLDEVLLGFKKNGFGAGKYTGIGGKVEAGETIVSAAVRELEEETGVKAIEHNLQYAGHLTFMFPSKPDWSQVVHVFRVIAWEGIPMESDEVKPIWVKVTQLPLEQMWQDAHHWLPGILNGKSVRMRFVFNNDNETIHEIHQEIFSTDQKVHNYSTSWIFEGDQQWKK